MKRIVLGLAVAVGMALAIPPIASAAFGLHDLDVAFNNSEGAAAMQAGSHPFAATVKVAANTHIDPDSGNTLPDEDAKDIIAALPGGLVGNPYAVPRCTTAEFLAGENPRCSDASAVGLAEVEFGAPGITERVPVYSLFAAPGRAAKLGFVVEAKVPVFINLTLSSTPPYNIVSTSANISQTLAFFSAKVTVWGVPADPVHDEERGSCAGIKDGCETSLPKVPLLTLPTACEGPLRSDFEADSWQTPGAWFKESVFTHDDLTPPNPLAVSDCANLGFQPQMTAKPTTKAAASPTGLDFSLDVDDEGLTSATGHADSTIKKAVVTLPEGMSANPSLAEGLETCSEADLARESAGSPAGAGCPEASKVGTAEIETPLLEGRLLKGSLYIATPHENPFGTLIALYLVVKDPELGIIVRQPLKVESDPATGRLTTVAEEIPQLPFSHFRLHFREGARSPLASPPGCGTYDTEATLYPWSGGSPVTTTSAFQIISGPSEGPCPTGGVPPLHPQLAAGTLNNAAGRFSPFNLRLSRTDSEQEITHFSIKLPPGITAKLAGVPYCPDAAIEAAKQRTGAQELAAPSCPAASEVGHTLAGAGVGPALAYAPGKIYLAGPYHGSALSLAAITAAKVGPFDLGTVVVRFALKIDPETAEVFVDAAGSDPIPHIIDGIPVHLRDIRAYNDRPQFVLNPTSCKRTSTASTVLGSGLDFGSEADDRPITVSTPFQAADCAALRFKPRLGLKLKGGTKRGDYPAFKATLSMNGIGEAGIARAEVTLPKSEFIANAHFRTICTRVQFKEGAGNGTQCPAGSVYGKARATTPILGEPLTGPVFLRSSEHQLPDLVVALHNAQVDFDLVGHVDSVKGKLRNTFEAAPDAPVSSFVLEMQGGKKGLFENSTNLCKGTHRAESNLTGQNGKLSTSKPALKVKCGGQGRRTAHRRGSRSRR